MAHVKRIAPRAIPIPQFTSKLHLSFMEFSNSKGNGLLNNIYIVVSIVRYAIRIVRYIPYCVQKVLYRKGIS